MIFKLSVNECKFCKKRVYDMNGYAINLCGHGFGFRVVEEIEFDLPDELLIKDEPTVGRGRVAPTSAG